MSARGSLQPALVGLPPQPEPRETMGTPTGYKNINDVPAAERTAAQAAEWLVLEAEMVKRVDPARLHAASQAIEAHKRETGWRYLPGGTYRHHTHTELGENR